MIDVTAIRDRYAAVSPHLDERGRRSFAAAEARSAGYGGIAAGSRATGIAASTIDRGLACPPSWRRAQNAGGDEPDAAGRPDGAGFSNGARRPDVAAALNLQERYHGAVTPA